MDKLTCDEKRVRTMNRYGRKIKWNTGLPAFAACASVGLALNAVAVAVE